MRKKYSEELVCKQCGETFIHRIDGKIPKYCPLCYKKIKKERYKRISEEKEKRECEEWEKKRKINKKKFEDTLSQLDVCSIDNIDLSGKTLYIIGNGFDLMHGVKSSYRAFEDSMGKRNTLKNTLETYLKSDDIWSDFESALGHIRMDAMANLSVIEDMLYLSGFFEEDSGAAEFFMAQDMATEPMRVITVELEKTFRKWVDTLEIGTDERPLKNIIHDNKVLCFNYTEFIETLYGVSPNNICYIHGCRKHIKGKQNQKLILGHAPEVSDIDFEEITGIKKIKSYKSYVIDSAQENAVRMLAEFDEDITKNCNDNIAKHIRFFEELKEIDNVVVIGHSVSKVDWEYFIKISENANIEKWYFGCHGINDLENALKLTSLLGIHPIIFRTDTIRVKLNEKNDKVITKTENKKHPKEIYSVDDKICVRWIGREICITWENNTLKRIMQDNVKKCVISPNNEYVFVAMDGRCVWGISFFKRIKDKWVYIDELESLQNQNILNNRLRHIYINDDSMLCVYNNRIREYSLDTGEMISNVAKRAAKDYEYSGTDIIDLFV